jgi:hypothetical protein
VTPQRRSTDLPTAVYRAESSVAPPGDRKETETIQVNPNLILWLGGFKRRHPGNPAAGWQWVTHEPFRFANWGPEQPDNKAGWDDAMEILVSGLWRDAPGTFLHHGFIVEYDTPAVGRGGESKW